jgi:hypothetical protein
MEPESLPQPTPPEPGQSEPVLAEVVEPALSTPALSTPALSLSKLPSDAVPRSSMLGEVDYQVPSRFGLGAILATLTIFSAVFGSLKAAHAPGHIYYFVASLGLLVCLGQMISGKIPRGASTMVGAIFIPVWVIGFAIFSRAGVAPYAVGIPCLIIFGAFVGYAVGTLAAGCFLAMDLLESAILRWRGVRDATPEDQ